jgi:hypothetical protein
VPVTDPAARALLQRLILLMVRMRACDEACVGAADFCDAHESDWKRLEKDVRKCLGEPGAN